MARRSGLPYRRPNVSFGPLVGVDEDEHGRPSAPKVMCHGGGIVCMFLAGDKCTHVRPSRDIPDPKNTPDWCTMREGALRDAAPMIARDFPT